MVNLLELIGRDVQLRRTSGVRGGEYSGPCPLCRQGNDRFKVWPKLGRWACLGARAGRAGCDRYGDAIQYLRERDGLGYAEVGARLGVAGRSGFRKHRSWIPSFAAPRMEPPLLPPNPIWQERGQAFVEACQERLLAAPEAERAQAWLRGRGPTDETIRSLGLGYNGADRYENPAIWGLAAKESSRICRIRLPRGIVIPWWIIDGTDPCRVMAVGIATDAPNATVHHASINHLQAIPLHNGLSGFPRLHQEGLLRSRDTSPIVPSGGTELSRLCLVGSVLPIAAVPAKRTTTLDGYVGTIARPVFSV